MIEQFSFLKDKFKEVPAGADWTLLHNITINLEDQQVKLYFFNSSIDFLFKFSGKQIEKQYSVLRNGLDFFPLSHFLNHKFNLEDINVDTVDIQNGIYFLNLVGTSEQQYIKLFEFLLQKYKIPANFFFSKINFLNNTSITNLKECHAQKCIDVIRISIKENKFKVYSRTFRYHYFNVPEKIKEFLINALECTYEQLPDILESGGLSYDFSDGRKQLFTQNEKVKSLRFQ